MWADGIDVAERYAIGQASREELVSTRAFLLREFEEIVESDNGEIHARKQAVLATLQPDDPFDPTEAAERAALSVGRWVDKDEAQEAERTVSARRITSIGKRAKGIHPRIGMNPQADETIVLVGRCLSACRRLQR
jgi:hypothetical protein